MIIEDDELRELYKVSSSEHLQKLESELMILEKNPQDENAIAEFLREAHTLKGDSRMLGLDNIEMLVHQLEDCVEKVKQGEAEITPQLCDRLYQGIDAINNLATEAITGKASKINPVEILAILMGEGSGFDSSTSNNEEDLFGNESEDTSSLFDNDDEKDLFGNESENTSSLFDDDEEDLFDRQSSLHTPPTELKVIPSEPAVASASVKVDQVDTIRVEPQKLDILMTHANELTVTKLRISRQMTEIEQMLSLWEDWNKDTSKNHSLFDEIEANLPPEQFQTLKYFYNKAQQRVEYFGNLVNYLKVKANEDINSLNLIADRLESGIQGLRQLPLANVFNLFPRMVRDLARQQGKEINLIIEGGDTKVDKKILEEIKDPLLHLIRNAIDHGIETPAERISQSKPTTATLILRGYQTGNSIGIEILDDGRGLNLDSIKNTAVRRQVRTEAELANMNRDEIQSLIFASGFSTRTEITELSGRGVGLDVVRANVEKLKGSIQVTSTPGNGCQFQIRLSTSLATTQVLIVEVGDNFYAIPVESIVKMFAIDTKDIYAIEDSKVINFEDRPISIAKLGTLLQLAITNQTQSAEKLSCVVLNLNGEYFGLIVDAFVDRQDVVFKPQSKLLKRVPNIAGATILGDGEVCMILNPLDLLHSLQQGTWQDVVQQNNSTATKNKLLLVEDSIIIRTQMQRLLRSSGYDVTIAVDGLEGFNKVQQDRFDIVVSDVEMPNMTGLQMTAKIRQHSQYDKLPIVLITTLASAEDKQRGKDAGANAYLTKGDFDQNLLFQTINQLIS